MDSFRVIGFLEVEKHIRLEKWSSFVGQSLALQANEPSKGTINPENTEILHEALEWLSLVPSSTAPPGPMPPLPAESMSPLDLFAYLLSFKLRYLPHERDMVILSHEVIAHKPGMPEEVHNSSLITYGTPKATAMARTVGLPVAIAALSILDGNVEIRGVTGPSDPSIYRPVLRGLEEVGLGMKEVITTGKSIESSILPGVHIANRERDDEEQVEWSVL
jgi:alpha-aminoadipic semialdehyde synthase